MAGQPLTVEEQAWANENAEAVRALMRKTSRPVAETLPEDPLEAASISHLKSLQKLRTKLMSDMERKRSSLERYVKMVKNAQNEGDLDFAETLLEEKTLLEGEVAKFQQHLEALARKIEALQADPKTTFLPLGAVVRFVGIPKYENSLSLSDDRKSYPVAGSIGVVTGLNRKGEYPISVSMRNEFKDGWGCAVYPGCDRLPTYFVDPEMLSVEEYGRLPDGTEYRGYGFLPTHVREPEKGDEQGVEMVIEAGGHFWRFHDFGGTQSIEALQAFDRLDEMIWIEGPLEHYVSDSPISSPRPTVGL
jgi:hypothetical protein